MILEIPLQTIPNQQVTFGANGQTFNMTITSNTVNNKTLLAQNADIDANTKIYTFATIFLGIDSIIQNTICNHAQYLMPYPSLINGYLFFYVDGADSGSNDQILYTNFGTTTHLYYTDYDALTLNYNAWVTANNNHLSLKYIYGISS